MREGMKLARISYFHTKQGEGSLPCLRGRSNRNLVFYKRDELVLPKLRTEKERQKANNREGKAE